MCKQDLLGVEIPVSSEVKIDAVCDKIRKIREIRPAGNGGSQNWWTRNRNSVDVLAQPVMDLEHIRGKGVCKFSDRIVLAMRQILLCIHNYVYIYISSYNFTETQMQI